MKTFSALFIATLTLHAALSLTPSTFFDDSGRVEAIFESTLSDGGSGISLEALHHAVFGLDALGKKPKNAKGVCDVIKSKMASNANLQSRYLALTAAAEIQCKELLKADDLKSIDKYDKVTTRPVLAITTPPVSKPYFRLRTFSTSS